MNNNFNFSNEHLLIIAGFLVVIYITSKLTKHLLPYSHWVEKVIQVSIIAVIFLEQSVLLHSMSYDVYSHLPISITHICAILGVYMLFSKSYEYFDVFYSWSFVCSLSGIIIFKDIGYSYPHTLYSLNIILYFLILFLNIYLTDVRKFSLSENAVINNLKYTLMYFSLIFLTNFITKSNFGYALLNNNLLGVISFIVLTNLVYLPYLKNTKKQKLKL